MWDLEWRVNPLHEQAATLAHHEGWMVGGQEILSPWVPITLANDDYWQSTPVAFQTTHPLSSPSQCRNHLYASSSHLFSYLLIYLQDNFFSWQVTMVKSNYMSQLGIIHNWVIDRFQWMVCWWSASALLETQYDPLDCKGITNAGDCYFVALVCCKMVL